MKERGTAKRKQVVEAIVRGQEESAKGSLLELTGKSALRADGWRPNE
jgi:hypothetical protein